MPAHVAQRALEQFASTPDAIFVVVHDGGQRYVVFPADVGFAP